MEKINLHAQLEFFQPQVLGVRYAQILQSDTGLSHEEPEYHPMYRKKYVTKNGKVKITDILKNIGTKGRNKTQVTNGSCK